MRAITRWLAAAVALALGIGASGPAASSRESQLTDLEAARANYVARAFAFTPERRAQALDALSTLEARAGRLSKFEFLLGIAHVAALAENAHDDFEFGDGAWRPPVRLPFRMLWFPDAMVVSRASPAYADLLGAQVITIDGYTPDEIFSALTYIDGGTLAYRSWNSEWAVESPGVLNALHVARSAASYDMRLRLADGRIVARSIPGVDRTSVPVVVDAPRLWSPQPFLFEASHGWRTANATARVPVYLQDPDSLFRMAELPRLQAVYVQFRSNRDEGDQKVLPFVQRVMQRLKRRPRNLILDLRFDTGGDNTLTLGLMRAIPTLVASRIYLMTGRYTFSAGMASAAALKHAGGTRVTIVGEPVGDRLQWWSEGRPTCLPDSHLCLTPNTGFWDLAHGCSGKPHCYGDQFDSVVGSLDPQISAPLTAQAWLAGDDPGMDAIARDLASSARNTDR
jgi:hypothetical protein